MLIWAVIFFMVALIAALVYFYICIMSANAPLRHKPLRRNNKCNAVKDLINNSPKISSEEVHADFEVE